MPPTGHRLSTPPEANLCPASNAAYWEHRLRIDPGLKGVGNTALGREFNEWMYRVRKRVFLKRVAELEIDYSSANILDIGSGSGFWLEVWRSLGAAHLTGSDLTNIAVERLRAKFPSNRILPLDITVANANEIVAEKFDVISAFDVLFHIVSDESFHDAISNISSMLKPGGWFLFTENLPHRDYPRADTQVNRKLEDVTSELSQAGLLIQQRVPIFVLMNSPVDSRWSKAMLLWKLFMRPVFLYPPLGNLYGAVLYPLENFLVDRMKEGPSTEFVVCRKI